jgi:hypothetical protein
MAYGRLRLSTAPSNSIAKHLALLAPSITRRFWVGRPRGFCWGTRKNGDRVLRAFREGHFRFRDRVVRRRALAPILESAFLVQPKIARLIQQDYSPRASIRPPNSLFPRSAAAPPKSKISFASASNLWPSKLTSLRRIACFSKSSL